MTEFRAHILILTIALVVVGVAVVGLAALGANSSTIALGVIIPAMIASYLSSQVVMHYGEDASDSKR